MTTVHVTDRVHVAVAPHTSGCESQAARALLRSLLGDDARPLAAEASGRPYLPGRPDLAVSLSHTDGFVAAAVGRGVAVGVDVQAPVPISDAVLRRCCSPEVRDELSALPSEARDLEFAWIWSAQECCVKATGEGLAGRPWTIPVRRGQRRGTWRAHTWHSLRDASAVPLSVAFERKESR